TGPSWATGSTRYRSALICSSGLRYSAFLSLHLWQAGGLNSIPCFMRVPSFKGPPLYHNHRQVFKQKPVLWHGLTSNHVPTDCPPLADVRGDAVAQVVDVAIALRDVGARLALGGDVLRDGVLGARHDVGLQLVEAGQRLLAAAARQGQRPQPLHLVEQ